MNQITDLRVGLNKVEKTMQDQSERIIVLQQKLEDRDAEISELKRHCQQLVDSLESRRQISDSQFEKTATHQREIASYGEKIRALQSNIRLLKRRVLHLQDSRDVWRNRTLEFMDRTPIKCESGDSRLKMMLEEDMRRSRSC